jgi:rhodanese-related sulfurtransferase
MAVPRQITVHDLAAKLKAREPVYLLDVRQPWEHELVALPGSVHFPLQQLASRAAEVQPPAEALIVVYCHHGIRSLSGAGLLERHGLTNVVSLAGGIDAWSLEIDPQVPRY